MSIKKHPEYSHELTRLNETKQYIESVIDTGENNESELRSNIRQAYLRINSLDASEGYISLLTNVKFLEMTKQNLRQLQQIQSKPYFCRIDIRPEESEDIHKLYIGKASLFRPDTQEPVIVDWRSPIANVYYEGRIGEVTYETQNGTAVGELFRKRQYTIEKGILEDFKDIDITTRDELLQESLGGSADNRLKDIVSTIQEEQNRVIRAEMYRPMVVQGAAGSGKTTIALHRIAYLIYTHGDNFDPDQFMILAPHQLFLKYIANVLPELGVEAVKQTTFVDFMQECIGSKVKLADPNDKLHLFLEGTQPLTKQESDTVKFVSLFKGSVEYKQLIDNYLQTVMDSMLPNEDFKLGKHVLCTKEELHKLFHNDYIRLPIYKRVDKIKKILQDRLKTKKQSLLKEIELAYDEKIESAMFTYTNAEQRRSKVVLWMDRKEQSLKEVEEKSKTLVKDFINLIPKQNLLGHFREFLSDLELLNLILTETEARYLQEHSFMLLDTKRIEIEDAASLMYLNHKLYGVETAKIRNLVIDEAQDYSIFQLIALKEILGTDMFTILGDLSQGIHSYRGIQSWEEVLKVVFPNGNCNYLVLEQSYRTTIEIMNYANAVIKHSITPGLIPAKPVLRHGDEPKLKKFNAEVELATQIIDDIAKVRSQGLHSIAVIGKTKKECKALKKLFDKQKSTFSFQVLDEKESYNDSNIVIVPAYVVKGLEFDAVFIVSLEDVYTLEDLDVKLLYVAMTRPLHKMFIYAMDDKTDLLDRIS